MIIIVIVNDVIFIDFFKYMWQCMHKISVFNTATDKWYMQYDELHSQSSETYSLTNYLSLRVFESLCLSIWTHVLNKSYLIMKWIRPPNAQKSQHMVSTSLWSRDSLIAACLGKLQQHRATSNSWSKWWTVGNLNFVRLNYWEKYNI